MSVEILVMALVLANGGYIYYLHRRLRRLDEANRRQAAADRRLVVSALEVSSELRAVTADLKKHEAAAVDQFAKLFRLALKIVDREYGNRPGNGRANGQPSGARPGNGKVRHEQPGVSPYLGPEYGIN